MGAEKINQFITILIHSAFISVFVVWLILLTAMVNWLKERIEVLETKKNDKEDNDGNG